MGIREAAKEKKFIEKEVQMITDQLNTKAKQDIDKVIQLIIEAPETVKALIKTVEDAKMKLEAIKDLQLRYYEYDNTFEQNINEALDAQYMTIKDLSEITGLTISELQDIISNYKEASTGDLAKIAEALGYPLATLIHERRR